MKVRDPDRREMPAYSAVEISRYLNIPVSTVRWWSLGQDDYSRLIEPAATNPLALSFYNLVELHVINSVRREHNVKMRKLRASIDFLKKRIKVKKHPLLSHQMETDGVSLFIEHLGRLINISQDGQTAMRELLEASLSRIKRDPKGLPIKLYPFTVSLYPYSKHKMMQAPSLVVIDPSVSAGRPVIEGTGLATEIIAERYKAGESIKELVRDYGRRPAEIEEAIRCELQAAA